MPADYDIAILLGYIGPSTREQQPIENGVRLLDYRNTDSNEHNLSILLSSQNIPFHLERPEGSPRIRMVVTIPRNLLGKAEALLLAAAKISAVEVVEGNEGLFSR